MRRDGHRELKTFAAQAGFDMRATLPHQGYLPKGKYLSDIV